MTDPLGIGSRSRHATRAVEARFDINALTLKSSGDAAQERLSVTTAAGNGTLSSNGFREISVRPRRRSVGTAETPTGLGSLPAAAPATRDRAEAFDERLEFE